MVGLVPAFSLTNFNLQQSFLKLYQEMFKGKIKHSDSENKDLPKYIFIINAGFPDQKQLEDKIMQNSELLICFFSAYHSSPYELYHLISF